ncbi:hypothetical protein FQN51_006353 [Onygenales sp. PD_10]|nr:hypothetical protein FQN51_006353 [Onygenales sp. PD_10]
MFWILMRPNLRGHARASTLRRQPWKHHASLRAVIRQTQSLAESDLRLRARIQTAKRAWWMAKDKATVHALAHLDGATTLTPLPTLGPG